MKTMQTPKSPKAQEKKLEEIALFMVGQITKRFKNGVIKRFTQTTINKFADAQEGNFSRVALDLSKDVRRSVLKQFSRENLSSAIKKVLERVNNHNAKQFYSETEEKIGLNPTLMLSKEGLNPTINAFMQDTINWVETLRNDTLEECVNNTIRAMTLGDGYNGLLEVVDEITKKNQNRAKFIARGQINTFNSLLTKVRAQELGLTKGIWQATHDSRVRESHKKADNQQFDLSKGYYSSIEQKHIFPGVDYGCRCTYKVVIDED